MLPLTGPAVSSLIVFQFMWTWNAFLMPLIYLQRESLRPLALGLMFFEGRYTQDYGLIAGGVTIATFPIILVYVLLQRQFIRGLTAGAFEGMIANREEQHATGIRRHGSTDDRVQRLQRAPFEAARGAGPKHRERDQERHGNGPLPRERRHSEPGVFDPAYRLFLPADGTALYPCNLGSWLVGEVIETGSAVTGLRVGDRVHGGMPHRPTNVVAEDRLYPLPQGADPEIEVFADPAIFALQAVHDAAIKVGDHVAVFGMGAIGLLAVQIARMNGAETIVAVDALAHRRNMAVRFGADQAIDPFSGDPGLAIKDITGKRGVDVAIEISGSVSGLQQAIRCVQREGLVVAASYYKDDGPLALGAEWHHNRITMRSSMAVWGCTHRCAPLWDLKRVEWTAIHLLESGRLQIAPMITHRFPYAEAAAAYALLETNMAETIKVLLSYT